MITSLVRLFGWKADIPEDMSSRPELQKAVYILAPHTSFWDFFIGLACVKQMNIKAHIFMKKEFFNAVTSPFLKRWGAIAVDRGNTKNNLLGQAVDIFNKESHFVTIICPEGTRQPVKRWKRGFYEIATQANVPIVCTYIDYRTKRMGVGPAYMPTGNYQQDIAQYMDFYQDKTARHPAQFNKRANLPA